MMGNGNVCTVLLNWNGCSDTLECLNSLVAGSSVPQSIVVVDNDSSDDSVEKLSAWGISHYKKIVLLASEELRREEQGDSPFVLIRNSENSGYAAGNNLALSWALAQDSFDYIWLLNNDTVVATDCLARLLDCAEQSSAAILGATVVYVDNPTVVQCAGGCRYNPVTTVFKPSLAGDPLHEVLQDAKEPRLDYIYGASMFVKTELFDSCGLLNEDYFLFYEELDFCKQAQRHGYDLRWCREAVVAHKVSRSVGRAGSGDCRQQVFANYHENLSTLIFTRKFYGILLPFVMLCRLLAKLAIYRKRRDWAVLRAVRDAYRDFISGANLRGGYGQ